MNLASKQVHQALTYISAMRRAKAPLVPADVDRYMLAIEEGDVFQRPLFGLLRAFRWHQAPMHVITTAGWAALDRAGNIELTALGQAALADLDRRERESDIGAGGVVVLRGQDRFALSEVMDALSERGPGALIDPYFDTDGLRAIVASGAAVTRVLVGPKTKLAGLRSALAVDDGPMVEIRISDAFHDRFFVPDDGRVLVVTTSLNGVGRKLAMMVELPEVAGDAVRANLAESWSSGEPLVK